MSRSLNEWFDKIITDTKRAKLRSGVNQAVSNSESIRKGIHRIPSASEANKPALAPLHHYVFCSHNIPYWRTCTKCGRDRVSAERNAEMILKNSQHLL